MDSTEEKQKRKVHRSPSYPAIDLEEAIAKSEIIYKHEKRVATTPEVLASHMGYSQATGPGGRAVSALRQYGLIEDSNGKYRLSDLGYTLVHYGRETAEWKVAAGEAARHPSLFMDLILTYPDSLPSDATLRNDLLKRGFNPTSIADAVSVFRNTMELAFPGDSVYSESTDSEMNTHIASTGPNQQPGKLTPEQQRAQFQTPPATGRTPVGSEIPVAKDCVMGVNATGRVTQEGIEKLISYLGLIKGSFPNEGENN